MRLKRRFAPALTIALMGTLVVGGCGADATGPGKRAIPARAEYPLWWQLTEACSGRSGSLRDIHWYEVPGVNEFDYRDLKLYGLWSGGLESRIFMAGSDVDYGPDVRHEMLHALLRSGAHDPLYFQDKCRGYVACESECVGGSPPPTVPPDAPVVSPEELEYGAEIAPTTTANSDNGGWIAVIITARNPFDHPVWVSLRSVNGIADTFAAIFDDRIEMRNTVPAARIGFAANSFQRSVVDIQFTASGPVPPGIYPVRPEFNWDSLPELFLTVTK